MLFARPASRSSRETRHARRESVAIAQVHCVDARSRARQRTERPAMDGDEAREARIHFLASEFQRQRPGGACRLELPAAARRQAHLRHRQRERLQHVRPCAITRSDLGGATFRSEELRKVGARLRGEDFAARIHQRRVVPARERLVLVHGDFEPVRPLPAQCDIAYPWDRGERAARALQIHREEGPGQFLADHRFEMRAVRAFERRGHHHLAEGERRLPHHPRHRDPREAKRGDRGKRDRERVHLLRVIPHARPAGFRRRGRGKASRPAAPPSAPGCVRSCPATC